MSLLLIGEKFCLKYFYPNWYGKMTLKVDYIKYVFDE